MKNSINKLKDFVANTPTMYDEMAANLPNAVFCRVCGKTKQIDPAYCLRHGWEKCCFRTMSLDTPADRKAV